MKSIYRCSKYGFLEIKDFNEADKADIELAALCVNGVYGASLVIDNKKLHLIFNPENTNLYEISRSIDLTGHNPLLHEANKTAYRLWIPCYVLKSAICFINHNPFVELLILGLVDI